MSLRLAWVIGSLGLAAGLTIFFFLRPSVDERRAEEINRKMHAKVIFNGGPFFEERPGGWTRKAVIEQLKSVDATYEVHSPPRHTPRRQGLSDVAYFTKLQEEPSELCEKWEGYIVYEFASTNPSEPSDDDVLQDLHWHWISPRCQ